MGLRLDDVRFFIERFFRQWIRNRIRFDHRWRHDARLWNRLAGIDDRCQQHGMGAFGVQSRHWHNCDRRTELFDRSALPLHDEQPYLG